MECAYASILRLHLTHLQLCVNHVVLLVLLVLLQVMTLNALPVQLLALFSTMVFAFVLLVPSVDLLELVLVLALLLALNATLTIAQHAQNVHLDIFHLEEVVYARMELLHLLKLALHLTLQECAFLTIQERAFLATSLV